MRTDEKVELGRKIANQLVGVIPSEWSKWIACVESRGLKAGIRLAQVLSRSPSLRSGQRGSYKTISETIPRHNLDRLQRQDLLEVLGYAKRWVESRRGFIKDEDTQRDIRH